jgi:hypothetical protein
VGQSDAGDAEVPGPLSDADRAELTAAAQRLYEALGTSWHGRVIWARSPSEFEALADYGVRRELLAGRDRWRAWRRRGLATVRELLGLWSLIALLAIYGSFVVLAYALMSLGEPSYYRVLEWIGVRELLRPLDAPHGFVVAGWLFGIGAAGSLVVQVAGFVAALAPLDRVRPVVDVDPPAPRPGWRRPFRALARRARGDGGPRVVVLRSATALASGADLTPRMNKQAAVLFGEAWSETPLVLLPRRGAAHRRQQAIHASRALRQRVFACAAFRRLVVLLEPPTAIRSEELRDRWGPRPERRLHSLDGPSLEWADGERHYFVHGRLTTQDALEAHRAADGADTEDPSQPDDEEPPNTG